MEAQQVTISRNDISTLRSYVKLYSHLAYASIEAEKIYRDTDDKSYAVMANGLQVPKNKANDDFNALFQEIIRENRK